MLAMDTTYMRGLMGSKERREKEREETRTLILDAARKLFVEQGYEAVTMRRIADAIDYTPTAIYFHFKDKEALIQEICHQDFLNFAKYFAQHLAINDPFERMTAIGLTYVEFAVTHPQQFQLMFMTPKPALKPNDEMQATKGIPEQDSFALLKMTCEALIRTGRIRPEYRDAELLAQVAWSVVHGVASLHVAMNQDTWIDWYPVQARALTLLDAFHRGITLPEN